MLVESDCSMDVAFVKLRARLHFFAFKPHASHIHYLMSYLHSMRDSRRPPSTYLHPTRIKKKHAPKIVSPQADHQLLQIPTGFVRDREILWHRTQAATKRTGCHRFPSCSCCRCLRSAKAWVLTASIRFFSCGSLLTNQTERIAVVPQKKRRGRRQWKKDKTKRETSETGGEEGGFAKKLAAHVRLHIHRVALAGVATNCDFERYGKAENIVGEQERLRGSSTVQQCGMKRRSAREIKHHTAVQSSQGGFLTCPIREPSSLTILVLRCQIQGRADRRTGAHKEGIRLDCRRQKPLWY